MMLLKLLNCSVEHLNCFHVDFYIKQHKTHCMSFKMAFLWILIV